MTQQAPLIPAQAGIQGPRYVALGPRNGVPATRASRGAPRGDERKTTFHDAARPMLSRAGAARERRGRGRDLFFRRRLARAPRARAPPFFLVGGGGWFLARPRPPPPGGRPARPAPAGRPPP